MIEYPRRSCPRRTLVCVSHQQVAKKKMLSGRCAYSTGQNNLPRSAVGRRTHALTRWVGVPRSQPHFGWLSTQSRPTVDSYYQEVASTIRRKKIAGRCAYSTGQPPKLPQSAVCRRNHALTRWVGVPRIQPHFSWLSIQSRQTSRYISSRRCLKKKMPSWPVCVSHRSAPQYARSLKKKMPRWPVCVFHRSATQYARCPDRLSFGETMP